jgi:hypothetical protein
VPLDLAVVTTGPTLVPGQAVEVMTDKLDPNRRGMTATTTRTTTSRHQ